MIIISKVLKENIIVKEDTAVSGILVGNADVIKDNKLYISGIMNGNIKVEKGGSLIVSGILNGDIVNNGGQIEITGIHQGRLL